MKPEAHINTRDIVIIEVKVNSKVVIISAVYNKLPLIDHMAKVIAFKPAKAAKKHAGNTLCKHNHHKWVLIKDRRFDNKSGKLVTTWECSRCKKTKNKAI